jgi:hypothetical protein
VVGGPTFLESVTLGWAKAETPSSTTLKKTRKSFVLTGIVSALAGMWRYLLD